MTERRPNPAFSDADASYAALVAALESVGDARAPEFLSRLVLLLAAEVGDHARIEALIARAAASVPPAP
ncbi:MAG: DUF2783 domain-containing protein [Gemmatimonadales bacterium]|nr:DUF2783 domain-containing protein [Gemmatimonadales bacterium]